MYGWSMYSQQQGGLVNEMEVISWDSRLKIVNFIVLRYNNNLKMMKYCIREIWG